MSPAQALIYGNPNGFPAVPFPPDPDPFEPVPVTPFFPPYELLAVPNGFFAVPVLGPSAFVQSFTALP